MRQKFIPIEDATTLAYAEAIAPWAAVIIHADGGWMAFESRQDYHNWLNQQ